MSRKSVIIATCSFFVLLVTGFFIWIGPGLKAGAAPPPVLGNPGHTISDFSFLDQQGDTITRQSIRGKVCVVEFFYTTCTGSCPMMNTSMLKVYTLFKNTPDFLILSHTVNPETDSVPVLKKYAEQFHADPKVWLFLTGPKKELYGMARYSYLLAAGTGDGGVTDFVHTQMWALVDQSGRLRGFYDSLKPAEVNKMIQDINGLLAEN